MRNATQSNLQFQSRTMNEPTKKKKKKNNKKYNSDWYFNALCELKSLCTSRHTMKSMVSLRSFFFSLLSNSRFSFSNFTQNRNFNFIFMLTITIFASPFDSIGCSAFFFAWVYCGQNGLFAWFVDNTIFIVQELKWKLEIFWTDERICQPPDRCSKNWTSFYIRARVLPDVNATQFNSNLWTSISNVAQSLNQREVFIIRKYFVESSNLMIHSDW